MTCDVCLCSRLGCVNTMQQHGCIDYHYLVHGPGPYVTVRIRYKARHGLIQTIMLTDAVELS